MTGETHQRIAPDVVLGEGVRLGPFLNLYGCSIGDGTMLGAFVEVQKQAVIGKRVKVSSHSFICSGVTLEDEVFVGHGVMFVNDAMPRATNPDGSSKGPEDWTCVPTRVCRRASIGSGATILCGITIGEGALVGAGSVVTRDVAPYSVVAGNPARFLRNLREEER